jgi:hypothetical protein
MILAVPKSQQTFALRQHACKQAAAVVVILFGPNCSTSAVIGNQGCLPLDAVVPDPRGELFESANA